MRVEGCVDDVWPRSYLLAGWRDPSTSESGRQYPLPTLPALDVLIDELYNFASRSSHLCLQPLHFRSLITATLERRYDYSVAWQFQRNLADFVQLSPENGECEHRYSICSIEYLWCERLRDLSPCLARNVSGSADAHVVSK